MTMSRTVALIAGVTIAMLAPPLATSVAARSFVIPHVLETSGTITNASFTFDTALFITYSGGLAGGAAGPPASVDLYLFDGQTGSPLQSARSTPVCNPCSFPLAPPSNVARIVPIKQVITAAGGFRTDLYDGFAVIVTGGPGDNAVQVSVAVERAGHGDPGAGARPVRLSSTRSATIPAIAGTDGPVALKDLSPFSLSPTLGNDPVNLDTIFLFTDAAGLPGFPAASGGATIRFQPLDQAGAPMRGARGPLCPPDGCTATVNAGARRAVIKLDDLIRNAGGGFPSKGMFGYATVVVSGPEADSVSMTAFVVNSNATQFDLSVLGYEPALSASVPTPLVTAPR